MIKTIAGYDSEIAFDINVNKALDDGWIIHTLCIHHEKFFAFMTKEKSARDDFNSDEEYQKHQDVLAGEIMRKEIINKTRGL